MTHDLSNLYIEKIASEHPLAVWMLNEDAFYVSQLSEAQQVLSNGAWWFYTNTAVALEATFPLDNPYLDREHPTVYRLSGDVPSGPTMTLDVSGDFSIPTETFDTGFANFAVGFYLYVDNPYATSVTYGYTCWDTLLSTTIEVLETKVLSSNDRGSWIFLSHTFDTPPVTQNNVALTIRITVDSGGGAGDYDFLIGGLSLGQRSEEFNMVSTGLVPSLIPTDISLLTTLKTTQAHQYGTSSDDGFYLCNDSKLFARNFGIPMTYGSQNSTKIYPNLISGTTYPSLIFPGYGFLNQRGKYNQYTAEMWLSINTDGAAPRKIFGPITGLDGLYVEGGFLTLVLGKYYGSHYVGNWVRPMLIHIKYLKNNISLLVNGEQVISLTIDENLLSLQDEFDVDGKSQDWLGFYAYEDTHPLSIDSFAIYSYPVPVDVAKRRWVWGQGVSAPETTSSSLNATSAFNDFAFANYAVNYNYPDFANWKQAFFSNLNTSSNSLSLPDYRLPEVFIPDSTQEQLLLDLQTSQSAITDKFFSFRPDPSWDGRQGYLFFKQFGVLSEPVSTFYIVFESNGMEDNQTLVKIKNSLTGDFFAIKLSSGTMTYEVTLSGVITVIDSEGFVPDTKTIAGINIKVFSQASVDKLHKFFADVSSLSLYIGGDGETIESTFTGKIYRVGFDGEYNARKVDALFHQAGMLLPTTPNIEAFSVHIANYTFISTEKYGIFFNDIAVSAYWEDYMPLSYFAKYTEDYFGEKFYDLDSLQINLDFPEPTEVRSAESTTSWTYGDLDIQYTSPVPLTYADLDNNFYTNWDNYQDLEEDSTKYYYYVTENHDVRAYISFQTLANGANKNLVSFDNSATARTHGVVDPAAMAGNWEDTKYEVVNGTIIYPPTIDHNSKPVDFNNMAIVYHLDFKSDGILHKPVNFRNLQFVSQVLERKAFTEIGTKFGVPVYPYSKTGLYYNFKQKNPIGTYKGSTPYLYLDRHSGFRVRGEFSPILDRGLSIPVNSQKSLDVQVGSIQLWMRFADRVFPTEETPIFYIVHKNDTYTFYLKTDKSTQRGYVIGRNSGGTELTNVSYSLNGTPVSIPYLINEEWAVLGVGFPELLDFSLFTGRINVNGPLTYNNISYYLATNLELEQRIRYRTWENIKNNPTPETWDFWQNSYTWGTAEILDSTNIYSVNPSQIYSKYSGTDRLVVDDNIGGVLVDPDRIRVYGDVGWLTTTRTAV